MIVGTKEVLYSWFLKKKIIIYIIYFKHILKYGWVGSGLAGFLHTPRPTDLTNIKCEFG